MITRLVIVLLILCLIGFFWLEPIMVNVLEASDVRVLGYSILSTEFRGLLGAGAIVCQIIIMSLTMLDHIGNTIIDAIKPTLRLLPLALFTTSAWNTLSPALYNLLPPSTAQYLGVTQSDTYITAAMQTGTLSDGVTLTLLMMLLFVILNRVFGKRGDSPEVQSLKMEIQRLRRTVAAFSGDATKTPRGSF